MAFEPYITKYIDVPAFPNVPAATLAEYEARPEPDKGYAAIRKCIKDFPQDADGRSPELIDLVKSCNLLGRGGAGFNAGMKWSFMPAKYNGPKFLACNADESEPGTVKDIVIMAADPHQLLEGMMLCSWACGINQAYIYIRGEMAEGYRRLVTAIKECLKKGYLGKGIFGTTFDLDIYVVRGSGAYICGEETGMLSSMEGKRPYPKIKPPFPANPGGGFCGHPTIVNNVETLANIPHIVRRGKDWFTSMGPEKGPGSKLICVSGHVNKPGIFEIELGTPLKDIIYSDKYCGGVWRGKKLKAVIPGGASAHIFTAEEAESCDYDFASVKAAGSMVGSGAVIVMDEDTSIVDALFNVTRFFHHESCGQCTPCRESSGWLEKILHRINTGKGRDGDVEIMNDITHRGVGRTVCALMEAMSWPVWSYTEKFRSEFDAYITGNKDNARETEPAEEAVLSRSTD